MVIIEPSESQRKQTMTKFCAGHPQEAQNGAGPPADLAAGVGALLAELRAGAAAPDAARRRLAELRSTAPDATGAAALLLGLRSGGDGAAFAAPGALRAPAHDAAWLPAAGDHVRVLKMGGAPGTVCHETTKDLERVWKSLNVLIRVLWYLFICL
jgi:hypothetical protein